MSYYDKQGLPLGLLEWARLFKDKDYAVIKQTRHKEKGREFWLSTVWLGLDHSFGDGPALIFETMAMEYKPASTFGEVIATEKDWIWQERYTSEDEALAARDPWRVVTTDRPDILKVLIDTLFPDQAKSQSERA